MAAQYVAQTADRLLAVDWSVYLYIAASARFGSFLLTDKKQRQLKTNFPTVYKYAGNGMTSCLWRFEV